MGQAFKGNEDTWVIVMGMVIVLAMDGWALPRKQRFRATLRGVEIE
jgi:hypothetical protein